jgi:hypothetical protein
MNEHVGLYACLRSARNALLNPPAQAPTGPSTGSAKAGGLHRRVKPVLRRVRNAVVWNKPLRRWIYLLDLVVFYCYRLVVEHLRGQVLIMDRYFYDTLVDVSDGRRWFWVRLLERITPTPTVPVFLDIGPEESFQRKGEYSVEYLRRRYLAYGQVFSWIPAAVCIVNHDLDATRVALWRSVAERVPYCRSAGGRLEASTDDRHP